VGQKVFVGGLKFDDIKVKLDPDHFDFAWEVWKEEKVKLFIQQRVDLIQEILKYFGNVIHWEMKDLVEKGFLFVVYEKKSDASTAQRTLSFENLREKFLSEEKDTRKYSRMDPLIFPDSKTVYSSWPKHVKYSKLKKKKKISS